MKRASRFFVKLVQEYLPNAYVLAIVLTFIIFLLGIFVANRGPLEMIIFWGTGYPELFQFAMQMVMVLITGYVLAKTRLVQSFLNMITDKATTPGRAIMITCLVSFVSCYLNWGFGLVFGALLAKEMGTKVKGLHFPLIIAAAYGGDIVRGPSSSIPLVVATEGHFMQDIIGVIPVSETLYSNWNLLVTLFLFILLPMVFWKMMPSEDETLEFMKENSAATAPLKEEIKEYKTFAEKMENSRIINFLFGLMPTIYIITYLVDNGLSLNLNVIILLFFAIGIMLHGNPMSYVNAVKEAVVAARGIILQFPLYAGMMGMMKASGLVVIIANWFVSVATPTTFPLFTFLSAGLVNLFVPSGGGQWAVQGPIMVDAAAKLGADLPKTIMAFAWGDAWTNQIQPFWALPALGIAGLGARDIMGYCVIWTFISALVITGIFLLI